MEVNSFYREAIGAVSIAKIAIVMMKAMNRQTAGCMSSHAVAKKKKTVLILVSAFCI